jgi:hypothetical protein
MATATRTPSQTGNRQAGYNNAGEQAQTTALDITRRLQAHHFALSTEVASSLVAQGIPERQLPMLATACVAVNVSPNLLRYSHNIPSIIRVMNYVTEYGYRAGDDFFVSVFKTKVPVLSEDGEPTDQKAEAPTVVVMPSAARALENMKNDDRLNGVLHHIEASVIEDREEAKKIFEKHAGKNYVWGDDCAVAKAELYAYFKNGVPLGSGKPLTFYGFFQPYYLYQGQTKIDYNEANKPKPNYGPGDIAMKRAETKAARHVTKTNYARDNRTADQRLAALVSQAATRLTEAEQDADDFGVDLETALGDRESLHTPLPKEILHTVNGLQEEADGDALFMESEPARKAKPARMDFTGVTIGEDGKPEIARASEAQLNKLGDVGLAIHGEKWAQVLSELVELASNSQAHQAEDLTPDECNELIVDILGQAAFGKDWAGQVAHVCEKKKVDRIAKLSDETIADMIARLESKLFETKEQAPA